MRNIFIITTLFIVIILAACSKKASPSKTPKTTAYTADVLPLIQMRCTPCHLPSKGGNKANFENYISAKKYGPDMIARIQRNPTDRGFMPFKHDKLAEQEIAVFKKWVSDGLPEN